MENWFGRELPDPYGRMRDAKEPEVIDFTECQNAFTDDDRGRGESCWRTISEAQLFLENLVK